MDPKLSQKILQILVEKIKVICTPENAGQEVKYSAKD